MHGLRLASIVLVQGKIMLYGMQWMHVVVNLLICGPRAELHAQKCGLILRPPQCSAYDGLSTISGLSPNNNFPKHFPTLPCHSLARPDVPGKGNVWSLLPAFRDPMHFHSRDVTLYCHEQKM